MDRVHIFDHPMIHHKISYLRDKTTSTADFRNLVEELALLMAFEVLADVPTYDAEVETPLATAHCRRVAEDGLVIVPILRAGLGAGKRLPGRRAAGQRVQLDFRFGPRRADDDGAAVPQGKAQHVGPAGGQRMRRTVQTG